MNQQFQAKDAKVLSPDARKSRLSIPVATLALAAILTHVFVMEMRNAWLFDAIPLLDLGAMAPIFIAEPAGSLSYRVTMLDSMNYREGEDDLCRGTKVGVRL
jgi:hypothetical protein